MTIKVLTPPAYEPVSLAEMRAWCRIDDGVTDHDAVLRLLRQAMREYAENLTHRAFIQRTLRLYLDGWPQCGHLQLPWPPLVSVESFKYVDLNGDLQTLATDQYVVHDWKEPALIVPAWLVAWPPIRVVPDALQITYTAGYSIGSPPDEAANQEAVPSSLKLWMEARAATLFENREQLVVGATGRIQDLPDDFCDGLLDSLTVGTRLF